MVVILTQQLVPALCSYRPYSALWCIFGGEVWGFLLGLGTACTRSPHCCRRPDCRPRIRRPGHSCRSCCSSSSTDLCPHCRCRLDCRPCDLATLAALAVVVAALTFTAIAAAALLVARVDLATLAALAVRVPLPHWPPSLLPPCAPRRAALVVALVLTSGHPCRRLLAAAALSSNRCRLALCPATLATLSSPSVSYSLEPKDADCHKSDDRRHLRYVTHHGNPSRSLQGPHS